MKKYFIHQLSFRLVGPAVYGILIYLLVLLLNNNVSQINELFSSQEVYICIGLTYLSFESLRLIIILTDRFLPPQYEQVHIPIQLLAGTAISCILVLFSLASYFKYFVGFGISDSQLIVFGGIYLVSALLYNLLYFSNYFLQKENTVKILAEKQQRDVLEMEMMEFKNDINPDLLYEGLESVINLMYRDAEKAEEHIDNLASAYRYVLTNRQKELVTLGSEISAGKTIVALLNEKYYGRINCQFKVNENQEELQLIPGSIPVVLENVVRNTIITHHGSLDISCYMEDNEYFTIQSKLNDRLIPHRESSLALQRLQRSYSLYSDLPLIQVKAYEENYIKLPVLRVAEEVIAHS